MNSSSCNDPGAHELTRRRFLKRGGDAFGATALAAMLHAEASAANSPYAAKPAHHLTRAKRIIHVCALGGVSHVDTFDPKPELARRHGQKYEDPDYDPFFGQPGKLLGSPFAFRPHGQAGIEISDLLPHIAGCVDDIAFIRSMWSRSSNHTPATFFENTGFTINGFPGFGSWVSYGLGSENSDLPAYIVLPDPRGLPAGGSINWTSGFLPAAHQGVAFNTDGTGDPIPDLNTPATIAANSRRDAMNVLSRFNTRHRFRHPHEDALAARIRSYELAARMQMTVPDIVDVTGESDATRRLYGLDDANCRDFGRNCLLARRLSERGVRFVQLFHGGAFGGRPRINWDAHEDLVQNHGNQAVTMDKPVAGLLKDLKSRGLLDETLVLWSSEFGRTPVTQGLNGKGRDHHPDAFTVWMAGAGIRGGTVYGSSDELGFHVAEHATRFYDIHATLLHLMGVDHTALTFYHNGVLRRLTDVHGHVLDSILT